MLVHSTLDINETIKNLSRHKVRLYFSPDSKESLTIDFKDDQSLVTDFDLSVSEEIKNWMISRKEFRDWNFFSEEDYSELKFPSVVLDPIDGTRELVKGRDECVVSLALMSSASLDAKSENYAYIYNPFSGFEYHSQSSNVPIFSKSGQPLLGLISRSEWHLNLHQKWMKLNNEELIFAPRGSIAFKLALLASGACDFVVSFKPKNLWDIAAGTILLSQRGYRFYEQGKLVTKLDKSSYSPPLLWVHPLQEMRVFGNLEIQGR